MGEKKFSAKFLLCIIGFICATLLIGSSAYSYYLHLEVEEDAKVINITGKLRMYSMQVSSEYYKPANTQNTISKINKSLDILENGSDTGNLLLQPISKELLPQVEALRRTTHDLKQAIEINNDEQVDKFADQLKTQANDLVEIEQDSSDAKQSFILNYTIITSSVISIIILLSFVLIYKNICKPLLKFKEIIEKQSSGDFRSKIDFIPIPFL